MAQESLSLLIYGPSGSGKTTFGLSGPAPTLVLDAEQASKFIPRNEKVLWDPLTNPVPPAYDGTWKYCVVQVDRWEIAQKVLAYIKNRNHPFKTVLLDSVTEVVIKAKEAINNRDQFKIQHWGELSQNMGFLLRDLRDEVSSNKTGLEVLCVIAIEQEVVKSDIAGNVESRKIEPYLEGGIKKVAPYLFDITGHITITDEYADKSNPGKGYITVQTMFTGRHPEIVSKSRVPGLPPVVQNQTLRSLMENIYGLPEESPQPTEPAQAKEEPKPEPSKPVETKPTKPSLPSLPTK